MLNPEIEPLEAVSVSVLNVASTSTSTEAPARCALPSTNSKRLEEVGYYISVK